MSTYNVVYATNEGYASLAGVSMISLFVNNKNMEELDVYILADGLSEESLEHFGEIAKTFERQVHIIKVQDVLKKMESQGIKGYDNALDQGLTAYARLYIPELIPQVERVLYLDCDTLVVGDVTELFEMDLNDNVIGMAYDVLQNLYKKNIQIPLDRSYYNSGVMIMDTEKWIEKKCAERILEHTNNVRKDYPLVDQDLINVVLFDEIHTFSMRYNYLSQYFLYSYNGIKRVYQLKPPFFWEENKWEASENAVIFHFCGQTFIRPWYVNSHHPVKQEYDKYYAMSPWNSQKQKKYDFAKPYLLQYMLWRFAPKCVAVWCGKVMQRIFIKTTYGI